MGPVLPPAQGEPLVLGPKWSEPVHVAPLEVVLDCVHSVQDACVFEVRARVTTDASPVSGAFFVGHVSSVSLTVDGVEARAPAPLPASLARYEPVGWRADDPSFEAPRAFVVEDRAGTHDVVLRGLASERAQSRSPIDRFAASSALEARHVLFADLPERRGASVVVVAPGGVTGTVRAIVPSRWDVENRGDRACPEAVTGVVGCGTPDEASRVEGDVKVHDQAARAIGRDLVLGVRAEAPAPSALLREGGPVLGLGGAVGEGRGFRARAGWEVGLGASGGVLGSISADADFAGRLVLASLVEAATPAAGLRPSFGVGAGVPVVVLPAARVGGRVQLDLHLFAFGVTADVDGFPGAGVTGTILGTASF